MNLRLRKGGVTQVSRADYEWLVQWVALNLEDLVRRMHNTLVARRPELGVKSV